jgi:hypothetical protein
MKRFLAGVGAATLGLTVLAAPARARAGHDAATPAVVAGHVDGVARPAVLGCDQGHWPPTADGEPEGFDPGDRGGYRVWHDGSGWHLRTTTPGDGSHLFSGRIRSAADVAIVAEYHDERGDYVRAEGKTIEFRFDTHDHVDGLDFVAGCTDHVSFDLEARAPGTPGPRPVPADRVWLGRHGRAPANPFTVFRVG